MAALDRRLSDFPGRGIHPRPESTNERYQMPIEGVELSPSRVMSDEDLLASIGEAKQEPASKPARVNFGGLKEKAKAGVGNTQYPVLPDPNQETAEIAAEFLKQHAAEAEAKGAKEIARAQIIERAAPSPNIRMRSGSGMPARRSMKSSDASITRGLCKSAWMPLTTANSSRPTRPRARGKKSDGRGELNVTLYIEVTMAYFETVLDRDEPIPVVVNYELAGRDIEPGWYHDGDSSHVDTLLVTNEDTGEIVNLSSYEERALERKAMEHHRMLCESN